MSPGSLVASVLAFVVLDAIWLGLIMRDFYSRHLMAIARLEGNGLAPLWSVAWLVYVLLGTGVAIFVVPRAHSVVSAAALGALFGIVVYGVYDLTNYSTLAQWPAVVTIADIAWGAAASGLVAAAIFYGFQR